MTPKKKNTPISIEAFKSVQKTQFNLRISTLTRKKISQLRELLLEYEGSAPPKLNKEESEVIADLNLASDATTAAHLLEKIIPPIWEIMIEKREIDAIARDILKGETDDKLLLKRSKRREYWNLLGDKATNYEYWKNTLLKEAINVACDDDFEIELRLIEEHDHPNSITKIKQLKK